MAGLSLPPFFHCPKCNALYHVVKTKGRPTIIKPETACTLCNTPFITREGLFVLKYFLLRKGIPRKQRP
jgi:hypothetical protein